MRKTGVGSDSRKFDDDLILQETGKLRVMPVTQFNLKQKGKKWQKDIANIKVSKLHQPCVYL